MILVNSDFDTWFSLCDFAQKAGFLFSIQGYTVRISTQSFTVLSEVLRGIPQILQANIEVALQIGLEPLLSAFFPHFLFTDRRISRRRVWAIYSLLIKKA